MSGGRRRRLWRLRCGGAGHASAGAALTAPPPSPTPPRRWVWLHTARTMLAGLAFGSTLCGVLLLTKKGSKA